MTVTTGTSDSSAPEADRRPTTDERARYFSWAGWCGLAASAAYLVTILAASLLGSVEEADGRDDIVRYLTEVGDNAARPVIYGIAGIVLSVLFLPLPVAANRALRRTTGASFGSLAMVAGLVMLVPAYSLSVIEGTALASAATDLGPAGADALYVVHQAVADGVTISFSIGSVLTLGIAPLLWGIESRRTGAFARWLAWTGILVGVTGAVWLVWFLEPPFGLVVIIVNVVASFVYFVGLSLALIAAGRSGAVGR